MSSWEHAFQSRIDLVKYSDNAIGLFALALRFGLEDLDTVAADSITDGRDDKKCDLVYIDRDDGHAVIAQCYSSSKSRPAAPSNKASDLNTAVAWLLQRPASELPERLRPSAIELREGILDGSLSEIGLWYVHNLPESKNVEQEMVTVEHTVEAALKSHFPEKKINVTAMEVGAKVLEGWYTDTQSPILVSEAFEIPTPAGFQLVGDKWKAYVTTIPGRFLHKVYKRYGAKLFSANVRDYLGSRRSDASINHGIKRSAEEAPRDFWVYNNGLTILVHSYEIGKGDRSGILNINGLSIVNGAQTTGALGSLNRTPYAKLKARSPEV